MMLIAFHSEFTSEIHQSATCQGEAEDNVPEYIEWA